MQRQYGLRLFKCDRLGCPFFRTGFEAKSERDRHMRTHDRPYKCDRPNCDFSHMGFGSQARLNVHLQYHEKHGKSLVAHIAHPVDSNDNEDVELIIIDAVKADDLDLVRDFIADVPRFSKKLLRQAVVSSSCEMLEVLLEACNSGQNVEYSVLADAVRADNVEATRLLLNRGASVNSSFEVRGCIYHAMKNRSPEMIKVLMPYSSIREASFDATLFMMIPLLPDISQEARTIQCLSLLRGWTEIKKVLENCFVGNAQRCFSIAIAEYLLQHGVNVNTRTQTDRTSLFFASRYKSKRAAELMKLLLEYGADPRMASGPRDRPIADRPGPRNISKWFGISWEQLVEESQQKHAASSKIKP